jgi:hypothetical protein
MKPTPDTTKLPKWAQAHIAELEKRITHLEGIPDRTPEVERDLPPPKYGWKLGGMTLSRGWDFDTHVLKSSYGARHCVEKVCSSCVHHGNGWEKTSSQASRKLFSTERRAWLAAKSDFIKWAAETVLYCDKQIAAASDEPYLEP